MVTGESKMGKVISFHSNPIDTFIYFADYIREWANKILKAVFQQRTLKHSDEDIGIILRVGDELAGRYILLFQNLAGIFSKTKITVQFEFESLSQEKTVVIICGLKIWCLNLFLVSFG